MPAVPSRDDAHQDLVLKYVTKKVKEVFSKPVTSFPSGQKCSEWVARADKYYCEQHGVSGQAWPMYDKSGQVHVLKNGLQRNGIAAFMWVASGTSQASYHFKPEGIDHIARLARVQKDCSQLYNTNGTLSRTSAKMVVVVGEKDCGKSTLLQNDCHHGRANGMVTYTASFQCTGATTAGSSSDTPSTAGTIIVDSAEELLAGLIDVVKQYDPVHDQYVLENPQWKCTEIVDGVEKYCVELAPPGLHIILDDITKVLVGQSSKKAVSQLVEFLVGQSQDSRHRNKHIRIATHDLSQLIQKFGLNPGIVDIVLFNCTGSSIISPRREALPGVQTCKEDQTLQAASKHFAVGSAMLVQLVMVHSWSQKRRLDQAVAARPGSKQPLPVFMALKHPNLMGTMALPTFATSPSELPPVTVLRPVPPKVCNADDVESSGDDLSDQASNPFATKKEDKPTRTKSESEEEGKDESSSDESSSDEEEREEEKKKEAEMKARLMAECRQELLREMQAGGGASATVSLRVSLKHCA